MEKQCEGCSKKISIHKWGKIHAHKAGWFLAREHHPEWVESWHNRGRRESMKGRRQMINDPSEAELMIDNVQVPSEAVFTEPTKRRICWPNPDATCLEGGCTYCNDNKYRAISTIQRYAEAAGQVSNRCGGETQDAINAFHTGRVNNWFNADSK